MVNGGEKTALSTEEWQWTYTPTPNQMLFTTDTHKEGKPSFLLPTITEFTDPDPEQAPGVVASTNQAPCFSMHFRFFLFCFGIFALLAFCLFKFLFGCC